MNYDIAIDGPAGAGKSTIAKRLAKTLDLIYVDTGAMYRAIGLYMIRKGVNASDEAAVVKALKDVDVDIRYEEGMQIVILNGENVNGLIRTEEVGMAASAFSALAPVRAHLLNLQQGLAKRSDVVMDGRDIGTAILPSAFLKIYLTASSKERAKRRYIELLEKGESADLAKIEEDIIKRDEQDMTRTVSPLKKADDAVVVDASFMNIEEVTDTILKTYNDKKETK